MKQKPIKKRIKRGEIKLGVLYGFRLGTSGPIRPVVFLDAGIEEYSPTAITTLSPDDDPYALTTITREDVYAGSYPDGSKLPIPRYRHVYQLHDVLGPYAEVIASDAADSAAKNERLKQIIDGLAAHGVSASDDGLLTRVLISHRDAEKILAMLNQP